MAGGCRITAIMRSCQDREEGSTPFTRSKFFGIFMKIISKKILADAVLAIHLGIIVAWFLGFWLLLKERTGGEIYRFFYPAILVSQVVFRGCPLTKLEWLFRDHKRKFFYGPVGALTRKIFLKEWLSKIVATVFTWGFSLIGLYLSLVRG